MKLRRLITRRRAKWTGMVASVCLSVAMIASYWIWPRYTLLKADRSIYWSVGIAPGVVVAKRDGFSGLYGILSVRSWEVRSRKRRREEYFNFALKLPPPISFQWLPTYTSGGEPSKTWQTVAIPLWIPLLLIAAPTVYFWRTDRAKPWQCAKCRYDLRGLEGGVCPECGELTR